METLGRLLVPKIPRKKSDRLLGGSEIENKHVDWDKLPLLPEGCYIVRVTGVTVAKATDGSTQFWVELKARGRDERLSDHLTFNDKSAWRIDPLPHGKMTPKESEGDRVADS